LKGGLGGGKGSNAGKKLEARKKETKQFVPQKRGIRKKRINLVGANGEALTGKGLTRKRNGQRRL